MANPFLNSDEGQLSLIVTNERQLTSHIHRYELRSADGSELPLVTAGSHIGIQTAPSSGRLTIENYQICSNPIQRDFYEIAAIAMSEKNEKDFQIGDQLNCTPPTNNFHLHADASPA